MTIDAKLLQSYMNRLDALEKERESIADDMSGIYQEAKSNGFSDKAIKELRRLRRKDPELRALVEMYNDALPAAAPPTRTRAREDRQPLAVVR